MERHPHSRGGEWGDLIYIDPFFSVSENSHTTSSSVYGRHHASSQHSSNEESKLIPNYTPPQIGSQDDKAGGSRSGHNTPIPFSSLIFRCR